jgi:hypothetical protein
MIKLLGWNSSGVSLLVALLSGLISSLIWKQLGLDPLFNVAGVGLSVSLVSNYISYKAFTPGKKASQK